jgi:outer membrane PBP1 activator LpoA protein
MIRIPVVIAAALLAGCATVPPPPLVATHPASPEAPEGARLSRLISLNPDDATRKTRALLSAAQKEQEQWDAHGPVSGTPENAPESGTKPKLKHEHH